MLLLTFVIPFVDGVVQAQQSRPESKLRAGAAAVDVTP